MKNKHMWLEAKLPSESDWIPLDPSFKLYDYVAGLQSPLSLTSTSKLLNEVINTSDYDKTIESVSTMKILELANNRDIRIYTITAENIGNALPALQLPDDVKNQIKDDVDAGQIVVVSEKEIQIKSWNGTGWASIDPETGSGQYMIYGGLGGEQEGGTIVDRVTLVTLLLEGPIEKIKGYEIIRDILEKFINNPRIKVITKFTERNIFDNLRDELVTGEQALMLIGVTKGVAAIGLALAFLGYQEYGVGLVAVKCIGNSYLPKLGGIIQSNLD